MALYIGMRWKENGEQKRSQHCYYDESEQRPLQRFEIKLVPLRGHDVAVPPDASQADLVKKGWTTWDGLWICPTHAKDLPP